MLALPQSRPPIAFEYRLLFGFYGFRGFCIERQPVYGGPLRLLVPKGPKDSNLIRAATSLTQGPYPGSEPSAVCVHDPAGGRVTTSMPHSMRRIR